MMPMLHECRASAAGRGGHRRSLWLPALAVVTLLVLAWPAAAPAQVNYTPLERGDHDEQDEKLIVLQGLTASGDYAIRLRENRSEDLPRDERGVSYDQDFRLHLNSVFNRDVEMHLELDLRPTSLDDPNLRDAETDSRNRLAEEPNIGLNPRQAYLLYFYNPNSRFIFGKHELSLGDRRGKTFNAIVPGATFDCNAGTWCMPFGAFRIGEAGADWVYHWALQFNAWDTEENALRNALQVEIFRIIYTERNIPLGRNLGPTTYDADDPISPATAPANQVTDNAGNLMYYDAREFNYFGLRIHWEQQAFFADFDVTAAQGRRRYHLYRPSGEGFAGNPDLGSNSGGTTAQHPITGVATELEAGYRSTRLRAGVRLMNATGDEQRSTTDGDAYLRGLSGYHEITPGTYQGARLYFNGVDNTVDGGAGLGHTISNTRMVGVFLDYNTETASRWAYRGGLYSLSYNQPIVDSEGDKVSQIGYELDNMVIFRMHKQLHMHLEINGIVGQGAFRLNDYALPDSEQEQYLQAIARMVYHF